MADLSFTPTANELTRAQQLLGEIVDAVSTATSAVHLLEALPRQLPEHPPANTDGTDTSDSAELTTLKTLAPLVHAGAAALGSTTTLAHMDPPTPWITWITTQWNAALNQNLLHPDLANTARQIEQRVINWLAPAFGMSGGHMTPGSTLANLTALWAAREQQGIRRVVSSSEAHLSIAKACNLLGLEHICVQADANQRMTTNALKQLDKEQLEDAAIVLTAGTTSTGAIDELNPELLRSLTSRSKLPWIHVDAAWAGPLRLSAQHRDRLTLVEHADSVAVSAHKWLYQPKESGLVFFRNAKAAHAAISFGGAYLQAPNVGLLGSHGATAVPLLATLLAWGRLGLEQRLNRAMNNADRLVQHLQQHPEVELYTPNITGVIAWTPRNLNTDEVFARLPAGTASLTTVAGTPMLRQVAANPNVDIMAVISAIDVALATPPPNLPGASK